MGNTWLELYRNGASNSLLTPGDTETFGNTQSDRDAKARYGSYNKLLVSNSGTTQYTVRLDGQTVDGKQFTVPSTGSFSIDPDEGVYFDFFVIEDSSAVSNITAGDLTCAWAIAKERR